jgi:hypothetical protein
MNQKREDETERTGENVTVAGFTRLKWEHLGGACEGANVPGGALGVVSMQQLAGGKAARGGLACSMTFVPNVAIVNLGGHVGIVSTVSGQIEQVMTMMEKLMRRLDRRGR